MRYFRFISPPVVLAFSAYLVLGTACSHSSTTSTTSTQSSASPTATSSKSGLRPWTSKKIANGLEIIVIQDESLPLFSLTLGIPVGTVRDPRDRPGLTNFLAAVMPQGAGGKGAIRIAQEFETLGSGMSINPGPDFTVFSTSGLSKDRSEVLSLFSLVVREPSFSPAEVERQRSLILAAIRRQSDRPDQVADREIQKMVFPQHPYGVPQVGTSASVRSFNRSDLLRHYHRWVRPDAAVLVVAGNVPAEFIGEIEAKFGTWQALGSTPEISAELRASAAPLVSPKNSSEKNQWPKVRVLHRPGLTQAQLRVAQRGVSRTDPQFMALRQASFVLGGGLFSRLMQVIRDDLGLTYGISAGNDFLSLGGSFEVSTATPHEKAGKAILEIHKQLIRWIDGGVTSSELRDAQTLMLAQFPASVESADQLAGSLVSLRMRGIPDSFLRNFQAEVRAVTSSQIRKVLQQRFAWTQFEILVYADKTQLELDGVPNVVFEDWKPD